MLALKSADAGLRLQLRDAARQACQASGMRRSADRLRPFASCLRVRSTLRCSPRLCPRHELVCAATTTTSLTSHTLRHAAAMARVPLQQFLALTRKEWIVLWRHWPINLLRCLIVPVGYAVVSAGGPLQPVAIP